MISDGSVNAQKKKKKKNVARGEESSGGPDRARREVPTERVSRGPYLSVTMLDDPAGLQNTMEKKKKKKKKKKKNWPSAYPHGYAVVDVETTGLARDDRIVSAAVYRLDAQGNVEDHWYTPVNPSATRGPPGSTA